MPPKSGFAAAASLIVVTRPCSSRCWSAALAGGASVTAFFVRKEAKAHGLQRRIEGTEVSGRRVLVVEDTSTTGGSVLTAVEALREAGADVHAVVADLSDPASITACAAAAVGALGGLDGLVRMATVYAPTA